MTAAERASLIAALATATKQAWVSVMRDADRVQTPDGLLSVCVYPDGRAGAGMLGKGLNVLPGPYNTPGWPARLVADLVREKLL